MAHTIFEFVREQDFLGKGINFKSTKNGNHQTFYGGTLSLIYYTFYTYFSITFFYDMFIGRHPSGFSQVKPGYTKDTGKVKKFSDLPFVYGFRIEDDLGRMIKSDDILFPIFTHSYANKNNGKQEKIRLNTTRCHHTIPSDIDTTLFESENFFCPNLNEIGDNYLDGTSADTESSKLSFYFSLCNHDPNPLKSQCKDPKKLMEIFDRDGYLVVSSIISDVKYFIDGTDKSFKIGLKNHRDILSPYKLSFQDFFINGFESVTDNGIISTDENSETAIGISNMEPYNIIGPNKLPDIEKFKDQANIQKTSIYVGTVFHYSDLFYYHRKYAKFPEFLAKLIGVMKLVLFCITHLSASYSKLRLKEFLLKRTLIFEHEKEEEKDYKPITYEEIEAYFARKNKNNIIEEHQIGNYNENGNRNNNKNKNENRNVDQSPNHHRARNSESFLVDIKPIKAQRPNENDALETNKIDDIRGAYELQSISEEQKEAEAVNTEGAMIQQITDPYHTNEPIMEEMKNRNTFPNVETTEDKAMKEKVSIYLGIIIRQYRRVKNNFFYSCKEIFNHLTVGKISAKDKIMNFYHKKIMKKFNIFNYLKKVKTLKIMKKTILNEEQIQVIGLKTSFEYDVDLKQEISVRKTGNEKDSQILNYFMNNYNPNVESPNKKILNYLVENDN